jgi:DNA-binding XRE family transcriptional regulator
VAREQNAEDGRASAWAPFDHSSSLGRELLDALSTLRGEMVLRWPRRRGDRAAARLYRRIGRLDLLPKAANRAYQAWRERQLHGTVSAVESVVAIVAANVRRLRLERSLTQEALADKAAMDASELRRIESGRRGPGILVIARLAYGLDVPPGRLLEGVSWRPPK